MPISATPAGLSDADLLELIDDVTHCPAYYQLLIKALLLPGLMELADDEHPDEPGDLRARPGTAPPAVHQALPRAIPAIDEVIELDGVGHIPMLEAPDRIADLIIRWSTRTRRRSSGPKTAGLTEPCAALSEEIRRQSASRTLRWLLDQPMHSALRRLQRRVERLARPHHRVIFSRSG